MSDFIEKHFDKEWAVITQAPIISITTFVVVAAALYWLLKLHFKERFDTQTAIITQKQSVIDDYKERLNGATPFEVAKEITDLKSKISELHGKIHRPQRKLTPEQIETMTLAIKENWGDGQAFYTLSVTPDTESNRFGKQILKIFKNANIGLQHSNGTHDEGESGVIIYAPEPPTDQKFTKIYDIFDRAGIKYSKGTDEASPDQHYIFICPEEL